MLQITEIAGLLRAWRLSEPLSISPAEVQGDTSSAWSVTAGDRRFIAKLIHDRRRYAEPGLRVASAVDEGGVATGAPLLTADGELCIEVHIDEKSHTLALLQFVPGQPLDASAPQAPEVAGALLGRVHAALRDRSERSWVPADLLEWSELYAATTPGIDRGRVTKILATLRALQKSGELTSAVVYGDPSPEILVGDNGEVALIDWGTPSWGPLLHDVACWARFIDGGSASDRAQRFLSSYLGFVELSQGELRSLPLYGELIDALQLSR